MKYFSHAFSILLLFGLIFYPLTLFFNIFLGFAFTLEQMTWALNLSITSFAIIVMFAIFKALGDSV